MTAGADTGRQNSSDCGDRSRDWRIRPAKYGRAADQALAVALASVCAFLTISSWKREGSF
jgi:hypothetical protein